MIAMNRQQTEAAEQDGGDFCEEGAAQGGSACVERSDRVVVGDGQRRAQEAGRQARQAVHQVYAQEILLPVLQPALPDARQRQEPHAHPQPRKAIPVSRLSGNSQ